MTTGLWRGVDWVVDAIAVIQVLRLAVGWGRWRPRQPTGDVALVQAIRRRRITPGAVACAVVDARAAEPVTRQAFLRCTDHTPFEIASVTKTFTGLLLADAVDRGEVTLDTTLAQVWPVLADAPARTVTLAELARHTSGLPNTPLGPVRLAATLLGLDPYRGIDQSSLLRATRRARLRGRGRPRYSNLGAALTGHALATRAESAVTGYDELLEQRILHPLGMSHTSARPGTYCPAGHGRLGAWTQPWHASAYAPAGDIITTLDDMTAYARAVLLGHAPGASALTERMFWQQNTTRDGRRRFWHNGHSGGYSSYLAIYPDTRFAVVVLASHADAAAQERLAAACITHAIHTEAAATT